MDNKVLFIILIILIIVLSYFSFNCKEVILGGLITYAIINTFEKPVEKFINEDKLQEFSKFSNIKDIDIDKMLGKNSMDAYLKEENNENYDNQDEIDRELEAGFSTFQPEYSTGISGTENGLDSNFYLAEPETEKYTVALNTKGYTLNDSITRKQQQNSSINKQSMDGYVRSTKDMYKKYFTNELNYQESKDWWSSEAHDFETDFSPYY